MFVLDERELGFLHCLTRTAGMPTGVSQLITLKSHAFRVLLINCVYDLFKELQTGVFSDFHLLGMHALEISSTKQHLLFNFFYPFLSLSCVV